MKGIKAWLLRKQPDANGESNDEIVLDEMTADYMADFENVTGCREGRFYTNEEIAEIEEREKAAFEAGRNEGIDAMTRIAVSAFNDHRKEEK